jgi:chemotaxis-related protein WspB
MNMREGGSHQNHGKIFLIFRLGQEQYALEAARVIEVIPRLPLRPQPGAPRFVAGLLNFRGQVVPVLDLGILTADIPCVEQLSTRIILIQYRLKCGGQKLLGLIAEAVTDAVKRAPDQFMSIAAGQAPYLGRITLDEGGMVQCIVPERLLPPDVEQLLFDEPPAVGSIL